MMKKQLWSFLFTITLIGFIANSCKTYETPQFKIKTVSLKDTTKNIFGATIILQGQSIKTNPNGTADAIVDLDGFLLDRIEINAQSPGYYDFKDKVLIGKDQQETIVLKMTPKDSLFISPDTLVLSINDIQKDVKIQNLGLGSLEAIYGNNDFSWIELGRNKDTIPPTPAKYLTVVYKYNPAHQCVIRGSINIKWGEGANQKQIPVIKYIEDNGIPSAAFNVSPQSLISYINSKVFFDASQSTDNCQATVPLKYRWDFEGSGVFTEPWTSNPSSEYIYTSLGKRMVTLEVKDGANNIASAKKEISVIKLINFLPVSGNGGGQNLFHLGDNNSPFYDQKPGYNITLNYFLISETEVTNEQYISFLNIKNVPYNTSSAYLNIMSPNSHIKYNNGWYVESGFEQYPVVAVSWNGAVEFCKFVSGRLPTEAEWEAAARGAVGAQPVYPEWAGSTISPDNVANYLNNSQNKIRPVQKLQKNGFNIYDMSGNVAEWCSDWYDDHYNISDNINPQGPNTSPLFHKVIRGGSYKDPKEWITVTYRDHESPAAQPDYVGFRVVQE